MLLGQQRSIATKNDQKHYRFAEFGSVMPIE